MEGLSGSELEFTSKYSDLIDSYPENTNELNCVLNEVFSDKMKSKFRLMTLIHYLKYGAKGFIINSTTHFFSLESDVKGFPSFGSFQLESVNSEGNFLIMKRGTEKQLRTSLYRYLTRDFSGMNLSIEISKDISENSKILSSLFSSGTILRDSQAWVVRGVYDTTSV